MLASLLLLACVRRSDLPDPPPPHTLPTLPPHAATAAAARDALLFGDVDGWRRGMDTLAAPAFLEGADPERRAAFQAVARAASGVPTLAEAAAATGQLGVACGDCHARERVRMTVSEDPPADGDGVRAEMERHARGLRLAWGALVSASHPLADEAVQAFEQGWLSPVSGGDDPAVQALDGAVTAAAGRFGATRVPEEQARAFGELIVACHACHTSRPGGLRIEPE